MGIYKFRSHTCWSFDGLDLQKIDGDGDGNCKNMYPPKKLLEVSINVFTKKWDEYSNILPLSPRLKSLPVN